MKRLAAIILSALILFSFAACDFFGNGDETEISSSIGSIPEESESTESNKGTGGSDESDSTESGKYAFISQEEKNTWRSALISVLSKSRVHEFEPNCPGSISVGLMDINFDNSPEVLVAYAGGSMNNIYIEIYDLKSDGDPITYDAACYGNPYNIRLYVAVKDGKFVLLSEGSLRIPETGWVNYICIENIDHKSNALNAEIIFESSGDSNYYEYQGQAVEKAEFEAMYQQFLLDYKKIDSTQIQMIRWSDIGEVEKRRPETKSSAPVYTREEIAEKMADALINSSQQFIKYDISDNSETNEELTDSQETESTESNNTETETKPEIKAELSEKYPDVPKAFDNILDAYVEIAYLNRYEGCLSREKVEDAKYPEVTNTQLDCIFYSLMDGWKNGVYGYYAGYAAKDINDDGISELFLTDAEYSIYAMFTLVNGEIVSHYFDFSYHNSVTKIDANGNFYYSDYGKGESVWYEISHLGADGILYRTIFGHYDMTGFGDPEVYNYYCAPENSLIEFPFVDGDRLTDEEYNDLVAAYNEAVTKLEVNGYDPNEEAIKAIDLEFHQVIIEDLRK